MSAYILVRTKVYDHIKIFTPPLFDAHYRRPHDYYIMEDYKMTIANIVEEKVLEESLNVAETRDEMLEELEDFTEDN